MEPVSAALGITAAIIGIGKAIGSVRSFAVGISSVDRDVLTFCAEIELLERTLKAIKETLDTTDSSSSAQLLDLLGSTIDDCGKVVENLNKALEGLGKEKENAYRSLVKHIKLKSRSEEIQKLRQQVRQYNNIFQIIASTFTVSLLIQLSQPTGLDSKLTQLQSQMNRIEILMQKTRVEPKSSDEADIAVVRNIAYCRKSAQRVYDKASTIAESTIGSEYGENSISHPAMKVEKWIRNLDDIMSTVSSSDATSHPLSDFVSDDMLSIYSRDSISSDDIHDLSPEEIEVKISVAKKLLNQGIALVSDGNAEKASLHLRSALNLPLPLPVGNPAWNTLMDEIKYQLAKCHPLDKSTSELSKEDHGIKHRLLEWHQAEAKSSLLKLDFQQSETHLLQALNITQDLQMFDTISSMRLDLATSYARQRVASKSVLAVDILKEIQYQWTHKPWEVIYKLATAWFFLDDFVAAEKICRHALRTVSAEYGTQNEDYYRIVMLLVATLYARNVAEETREWLSRIPRSFLLCETNYSLSNLGIPHSYVQEKPDSLLKLAIYYEDFVMTYYLLKFDKQQGQRQWCKEEACRKIPVGQARKERSYLGIAASRGALAVASLLLDFCLIDKNDRCLYVNDRDYRWDELPGSVHVYPEEWLCLSSKSPASYTVSGLKEDVKSLLRGAMNEHFLDRYLTCYRVWKRNDVFLTMMTENGSLTLDASKSIFRKHCCTTVIHAAAIARRYAMVKFLLERGFESGQCSQLCCLVDDALHSAKAPRDALLANGFSTVSPMGKKVLLLGKLHHHTSTSYSSTLSKLHTIVFQDPNDFVPTGPAIDLLEIAILLHDRELMELLNPYFEGRQFGETAIASHTENCCQVQNAQNNIQIGTTLHSAFVLGRMWLGQRFESWICDLLQAGAELDENETKHQSALHWAIVADFPEAIKILVQKRHTLNANEVLVGGAFYHAICSGSHQAVKALKMSNYRDEDGVLKYHMAMRRLFSKDSAGMAQVYQRRRDFLKALQNADLVELEASNSSRRTLLLEAINLDGYFLDIVILQLIELGVNLDMRDRYGVSPTNKLCSRLYLRSPAKKAWKTPFSRDRRQDWALYHMDDELHCLEMLLHIVEAGAHVNNIPRKERKERKESEPWNSYNQGNDLKEMYRTWMKIEPGKFHDYRIKALTGFMKGSPQRIMECMCGTDGHLSPDQCYLFCLEYITGGSVGLGNVQSDMTRIFKR